MRAPHDEEFTVVFLRRESICACTHGRTCIRIYSSNLHPQSGPFGLNTADVRAGESLTWLLVEIFRAQLHRWRGSRRERERGRETGWLEFWFSHISEVASVDPRRIEFIPTEQAQFVLRGIRQVCDLAYWSRYPALSSSLRLVIEDALREKNDIAGGKENITRTTVYILKMAASIWRNKHRSFLRRG